VIARALHRMNRREPRHATLGAALRWKMINLALIMAPIIIAAVIVNR